MHMQTQFGIPTSNNIGVMLRARLYLKRGQGQQGHSDPKWCATPRCPAISRHLHKRNWIPTSNNVGDMLHTHTRARARTHACQSHQGHSDQKWCATLRNPKKLAQTKFGFLLQIV